MLIALAGLALEVHGRLRLAPWGKERAAALDEASKLWAFCLQTTQRCDLDAL